MIPQPQYSQVNRRHNLSLGEFRETYLRPQRPVVITDAIEHWPARSLWTFAYFKERFGTARVGVHRYDEEHEFRPDAVSEMTLGEYVDAVTTKDWKQFPYYLRDNWRLFHAYPELLEQHDVPAYFFDWFRFLPEFMRLPYPRIFIGPKGAVTPLHADIWGTHAWLSQLVGRKRWLLFSPEQKQYLYDYDVRCEAPDFNRHPLYRNARPLEAVIGPGDTIWVPSNWSHWVHSLEAGISITYNYMGPGCFASCLSSGFKSAFSPARVRRTVAARLRPQSGQPTQT
jgi:histone arginine demethylase JMJD6